MATLRLGNLDDSIRLNQTQKKAFFKLYHPNVTNTKFRDHEKRTSRDFRPVSGQAVRDLQQFLFDHGLMPNSERSGIFGYGTRSAVRLFQEYVRTIEGKRDIGVPDGVVGSKTQQHVSRWKQENIQCEWAAEDLSTAYTQWMQLLKDAHKHYTTVPSASIRIQATHPKLNEGGTRSLDKWDFDTQQVHLIGIRRNADVSPHGKRRKNDDLFVLLVNGKVFKFWGSTDPRVAERDRKDEPYLTEGQHVYNYGWHHLSKNNIYRYPALKPQMPGVLVFRDRNGDNALTNRNIDAGLDAELNDTINIHWSGQGHNNFSAGCQVISGASYINPKDEIVNCKAFSALNSKDFFKKTKAAYNVMADLMLIYGLKDSPKVIYTLLHQEVLDYLEGVEKSEVADWVKKLKK